MVMPGQLRRAPVPVVPAPACLLGLLGLAAAELPAARVLTARKARVRAPG